MNNSKFWNGSKQNQFNGDITPMAASSGLNASVSNTPTGTNGSKNMMKNKKSTKLVRGLGTTGIILLVIATIIAGLSYVFVISPAYSLMTNINTLKADGGKITESLKSRDLVALEANIVQTEKDLTQMRSDRDSKFGWAKDIKLFKLNEFYSDSDRFINAGLYSLDALRETSNIVKPFADAAGLKITEEQEVKEELGLMEAFQTWVSIMPQVADQMDGVISKVSKVGKELEPINTAKYPTQIKGIYIRSNLEFLKRNLSSADQYGPDIKQALSIFPGLLGINTPAQRYMIIMQNDKEIRPTGGFMTNYATFIVDEGLLKSDFSSKDMYSIDLALDDMDAYYDFPDAPQPYPKYLKVERWYARDMNFSPDFVISMDQFLLFYNKAGQLRPAEIKPVSGVLAIDTQVVKEMLDVTGPVTVNGITYTSENVVLELEKIASLELREQQGRKKVLGDLMESMLINVFESEKSLWSQLIDKAVSLAIRKHIQAYVFDPQAEALIERYGFGGRIQEKVDGDYSMVVSTNLGGDKTNWFTHKKVTHTLEEQAGKWIRTVKIDYTYTEPSGEYAPFVKRFKDWVRVYAPAGSEFIGVEGSEDGTMTDQERNKVWFSGYVEMGPGESKSLTFKYALPAGVITGDTYNLLIQKQGGIDSEKHLVVAKGDKKEVDLTKDAKVMLNLK